MDKITCYICKKVKTPFRPCGTCPPSGKPICIVCYTKKNKST